MKFFRLTLFVIPLLFSQNILADKNEVDDDITNPGTGTFSVKDDDSQQKMEADKQLKMEKEEAELDEFGEDKYNENVDSDISNQKPNED